ncbi:hypothetical protein HRbin04_00140 [archaeon HR04]|nr:hypothetical protein HRbin04_00140 [archaeon HR04]
MISSREREGIGRGGELRRDKNVLVLCIDRDDDIGSKAGIGTPVVGRDECINAGVRLAIEDPEDADSNAIFAAVKVYEELVSKGYKSEIALLSGSYRRGVEADERIVSQLHSVLKRFSADAVVIVSDGSDDESVLPVIQGIVPVISVQRVVIKHSRSVEYSYALLARYLRSLIYDPRYSKFFLGIPGALLLAGGLSIVLNLADYALPMLSIILGAIFLVRAFDVDRTLLSITKSTTPSNFVRVFSIVAGIIIVIASLETGYVNVQSMLEGQDALSIILNKDIITAFLINMLPLLWIGIGVILGGRLLSNIFRSSIKAISDALRLVVLGLFYIPVQQLILMIKGEANPFSLVSSLLLGFAVTLIAVTLVYEYYRKKASSTTKVGKNTTSSNSSNSSNASDIDEGNYKDD